jgi:hypothetical protein
MKLVIANTDIHQDAEGRFSLNDLHKAAGGEERHLPKFFISNQQTQDLVAEISNLTDGGIPPSPLSVKKGGHNQGSYGVKELVYAYAMWISPKFHLQVIRTFDEVVAGKVRAVTTPRPISRNQVAASILLLRSAAEDLKFAPSAVLGGYQRLEAQLGVTGLLPDYAVDASSTSTSGSSEVTKAVGDLLEQFNVGMSAVAFNRLLLQHEILEECERPSTNGVKKFKSVVDLKYGKNMTNPNNPRETQPHWYVSKFADLLAHVNLTIPENA